MDKLKKELMSFGFGLAILIPYLVMLHGLGHKIGFVRFVIGMIVLLIVIAKFERIKILYFLLVAVLYGKIIESALQHGIGFFPAAFCVVAFIFLIVSCARIERLEGVFNIWMKAAHFWGMIFTGVAIGLLFYLFFAPAGIILRILRKDLLDQRIEPGKVSYWIKRETKPFDTKSYQQQF